MAVHVSVCAEQERKALRERIDSLAPQCSHADIAFRAGLHPSRLSQILSGKAPALPVEQAARLEDVLGVKIGTFFHFVDADPELMLAYLRASAESGAA